MRKGQLTDGRNFLGVKIEMFVTITVFATALCDHYYSNSEPFPTKLTKTDAKRILERQLFHHGISGEYEDGAFECSFEDGEAYNNTYRPAKEWVVKNYPYLTNPK